jgi:hypothetical protein
MARQLASGSRPSLSGADLQRFKQELGALGAGFESSLIEYPDLVAADGRQDFLHFFLYPLFVAPFVPLIDALGLHPNWAFTVVNCLMLSGALLLVLRWQPAIAAVGAFLSPIIWWADKAHTEAFLFAATAIAAAAFTQHPVIALLAYACAGAQNAAIGVTYPVFAALLLWSQRQGASTSMSRSWIAATAGAFIVAAPFVYTWMRLARWSPMAEYAQRVIPSPAGVAAFVLEPNIGLLPSAPVYGVALVAAVVMAVKAMKAVSSNRALWWWPAVIQLLLVLAWSQNPNANHGGTPGMNRWVLSLLALSLPWLGMARHNWPPSTRVALNLIVAIGAVMSAAAHLPARAEDYRTPTRIAERMWNSGWVHITPAEVFAERTQGREPAFAPSHDGHCRVLLIADQQAPIHCAPPVDPLPASCRAPGAMCYAVTALDSYRYVTAPGNGFFYRVAQPSWPAGGPLAGAVHQVMRHANVNTRTWRVDNSRRWRERFEGADLGVVLSSPETAVIHVLRLSADARARLDADGEIQVVELQSGSPLQNLALVIRRQ